MANTIPTLSYANTFGEWVVVTNALVGQQNTLANTNYFKSFGTLYLQDPVAGLYVSSNTTIGGTTQIIGPSSKLLVDNSITSGSISTGNISANNITANTVTLSKNLVTANATVNANLFLNGGISSAAGAIFSGNLSANNLFGTSLTLVKDLIANNITIMTKVITSNILSANINSTDTVYSNNIISNNITSTNITSTANITSNIINVQQNLNVTGNVFIGKNITGTQLIITQNSANDALKISQLGSGNAFVVEDGPNDSNPFIIDGGGNVAIGTTTTNGYKVAIVGDTVGSVPLYFNTDTANSYILSPNTVILGSSGLYSTGLITNNTISLLVTPSGNVGINNLNPLQKLDINGNIKANSIWNTTTFPPNSFTEGIVVDYTVGMGRINVGAADGIGFYSNFANTTANTLGTFDINGNFTSAGSITSYSDIRLKSDIETIQNALEITNNLRGVTFTKDGQKHIGVIAQEVREILPQVVIESPDSNKTLSVAYGNIVGVLIEAVKELTVEINILKEKMK